jgi:hypothetical protein
VKFFYYTFPEACPVKSLQIEFETILSVTPWRADFPCQSGMNYIKLEREKKIFRQLKENRDGAWGGNRTRTALGTEGF